MSVHNIKEAADGDEEIDKVGSPELSANSKKLRSFSGSPQPVVFIKLKVCDISLPI
jgi:hypothetical protein